VARVCKYDQGHDNYDMWRTFEKARLNCSIGADSQSAIKIDSKGNFNNNLNENQYPFYFDEIQHVYYDQYKDLIYAIFTTQA
jgi:hypothetical protein